MPDRYTMTLDVEVFDPAALFTAAMVRAVQTGIAADDARVILTHEGEACVPACLTMLLDVGDRLPGFAVVGSEIEGSAT